MIILGISDISLFHTLPLFYAMLGLNPDGYLYQHNAHFIIKCNRPNTKELTTATHKLKQPKWEEKRLICTKIEPKCTARHEHNISKEDGNNLPLVLHHYDKSVELV